MFLTSLPFGGRPVRGLKKSCPVTGSLVAFFEDKYSSIALRDFEICSRFSLGPASLLVAFFVTSMSGTKGHCCLTLNIFYYLSLICFILVCVTFAFS